MRGTVFFMLLVVVLICGQACTVSHSSVLTRKYSAEELKKDAVVLKNVLLEMHPAVGIYKPRSFYTGYFENFISSLTDSLTQKEFRLRVKLVIDQLHCGHTEVLHSKKFYKSTEKLKFNYSPYIFLPVKDRLFVVANLNKRQDSTLKKGSEITRINGVPADSMLRHCRRFISSDGFNTTAKEHYIQLGFNSFFPGLFGRPDTFEVNYRHGRERNRLRYPAIQLKSLPALPLGAGDDSLFMKFKRARISYRYLDEEKKTMIMRIQKFTHNSDAFTYRRIFRKLRKNSSENLIIDLRNNGGGSLANSYRLLSYLIDRPMTQTLSTRIRNYPYRQYTKGNVAFKFTRFVYRIIGDKKSRNDTDYFVYTIKPRKKDHFDRRIIVLINGGSFSASCLVAAYLQNNSRAVMIGEETGGTREGCNAGITPFYRLPSTGIRVRVPAFRVIHDISPEITGQGIKPDIEVKYGFRELITKKDLELEKAKEMLKMP